MTIVLFVVQNFFKISQGQLQINRHHPQSQNLSREILKNLNLTKWWHNRVSIETSFNSKQPKLVSALSETKCLFRLYRFYTETVPFVSVISIQVRNTETNRKFSLWFRETNQNTTETDLVSTCFGSNRKFFFLRFEDTLGQVEAV